MHTQVQVSETNAEDIMDESLPCGQPRVESTMVGLGPDRAGSLLPDSTVLEQTLEQTNYNLVPKLEMRW